ncbi:MAG TPA: hypothetical protein VLT16_07925 [Candidatus Limnocylindrales bacterium]|nr:hypothetical protein [Candidatus Limnocylindrales bacterium]
MRPIILIGANFLRTQRVVVLVIAVYLAGIAGVFALHQQSQEVLFFFQMHSFYVLFFGMMVAVPALQTERKSRRILAVLSKGIHRWQYMAGLLFGCGLITTIFSVLVGGITFVLSRRGHYPTEGLVSLTFVLFACSLMTASISLFYSAFLHPLLATGATTLTLTFALITESRGLHLPRLLFPVSWAAEAIRQYQFTPVKQAETIAMSALVFALVFLAAAAAIFSRRDVTISPE